MATNSVQRLVSLLQLPESREGQQITGDEAKEIWNEVVRAESTDPSGKPVEIGEKKSVERVRYFRRFTICVESYR